MDTNELPSQDEIMEWIRRNIPCDPLYAALGLAEEAGEVCRAALKQAQGIRGTAQEWHAEIEKEIGDVYIVLVSVAALNGIDLVEAVRQRWQVVRQRDYTDGVPRLPVERAAPPVPRGA